MAQKTASCNNHFCVFCLLGKIRGFLQKNRSVFLKIGYISCKALLIYPKSFNFVIFLLPRIGGFVIIQVL